MAAKMKWGDVDDDADDTKARALPPAAVDPATQPIPDTTISMGPDGVKTTTEYRLNDENKLVKTVTKVRVTRTTARVRRGVQARKKWAKFGDVAGAALRTRVLAFR